MAQPRFRRKDLKRPDEFVSHGRRALAWGFANLRRVYQIGAGVLILIVLVGAFYSLRGARARQANEDLGRALGELRSGDVAQAATQLADIASRWGSTGPGQVARLLAASAAVKSSNYATANVLLEDVSASSGFPAYLQQQALINLGYASERSGDASAAATRYAEAAALDGPYSPLALLGEARCRQQLGELAAARELYERFAREYPEAAEIERIELRIEALQGSG